MVINEPITKVNLERITNAIFAFTMTLLARDIVTPDQYANISSITMEEFFTDTLFSIFDFLGVFILLAMFWMLFFQMFHRMKTYDYHFLHIHMLALMTIVLIPFSSSFSNLVDNNYIFADFFFQINYFLLGIILVYLWNYARSRPSLLDKSLTFSEARLLMNKCLVPPFVAIIGIVCVAANLKYMDLLYFLPFIILGIFFRDPSDKPAKNL